MKILENSSIRYPSNFAGYDDAGNELRLIAKVNPDVITDQVRHVLNQPLLIIHDVFEVLFWLEQWKGRALIDCNECPYSQLKLPQIYEKPDYDKIPF